jgi:gluconokinase
MFNIQERVWDREILDFLGLDERNLPEAVPVEYQLPDLNSSVIQSLSGITKWIVGGADGPLAHLGTAGWNQNVASLTIGTSGAVRMKIDNPKIPQNSSLWCYVLNNNSYISGLATNNGGNVVDWYVNAFYPVGTCWQKLEERLASTNPDQDIFFIPFMFNERDLRRRNCNSAKFIGLKHWHTRDDLFRAVLEGVVFNAISLLDQLVLHNSRIEAVAVSGSLASSDFANKLFSATSSRPVIRGSADNASLLGLARIAIGEELFLFKDKTGKAGGSKGSNERKFSSRMNKCYTEKYCNWMRLISNSNEFNNH